MKVYKGQYVKIKKDTPWVHSSVDRDKWHKVLRADRSGVELNCPNIMSYNLWVENEYIVVANEDGQLLFDFMYK